MAWWAAGARSWHYCRWVGQHVRRPGSCRLFTAETARGNSSCWRLDQLLLFCTGAVVNRCCLRGAHGHLPAGRGAKVATEQHASGLQQRASPLPQNLTGAGVKIFKRLAALGIHKLAVDQQLQHRPRRQGRIHVWGAPAPAAADTEAAPLGPPAGRILRATNTALPGDPSRQIAPLG